jgi:aryl-alcohol dehydrogenase-like predicted oxidoreductase
LGQGYLSGKMDGSTRFNTDPTVDMRSSFPRFSAENLAANKPIVDLLNDLAVAKDARPTQIALAWVLAQKPWIVPIPGTSRTRHLEENIGALRIDLWAADLQKVDAALASITVRGGRMNAAQMAVVDQSA